MKLLALLTALLLSACGSVGVPVDPGPPPFEPPAPIEPVEPPTSPVEGSILNRLSLGMSQSDVLREAQRAPDDVPQSDIGPLTLRFSGIVEDGKTWMLWTMFVEGHLVRFGMSEIVSVDASGFSTKPQARVDAADGGSGQRYRGWTLPSTDDPILCPDGSCAAPVYLPGVDEEGA